MLPLLVLLPLILSQVQGWSHKSQIEPSVQLPYRVPFAPSKTHLDMSIVAITPLRSQTSSGKVISKSGVNEIQHTLAVKHEDVESSEFPNVKWTTGRKPSLTDNLILHPKRDRSPNVQDKFSNPMVHVKHLWKRSVDNDDSEENRNNFNATANDHQAKGGFIFGLNEIEITVIVVCSSLGLLVCVVGLIFLARYYWKKLHDNNHGYQGVLQRDSSEGSVGTGGVDVKEANAKFEAMDAPSKETDALLNNHQSTDGVIEKTSLPCANGTAVMEQPQIIKDETGIKKLDKETNGVKQNNASAPKTQTTPLTISTGNKDSASQLRSCAGLSQSNCSISSYTLNNPSYKYGNQTAYMSGYYGYPAMDVPFTPDDVALHSAVQPSISTVCYQPKSPQRLMLTNESRPVQEAVKAPEESTSNNNEMENENEDSPDNAEADVDVQNGTENSASSAFDVDTDISKHSVNNSCVELQEDGSDEALNLSESGRATSLPEGFSPTNDPEVDEEVVIKNEAVARPTDSGWGDTSKTQFRGSLPVIHLNVSPNGSGPSSQRCLSSTSYPVSESTSPSDFESKPLQSSRAVSNLSNTVSTAVTSKMNTKPGTILT